MGRQLHVAVRFSCCFFGFVANTCLPSTICRAGLLSPLSVPFIFVRLSIHPRLPPSANASQGFPNWNPPDFVVAAAQKALSDGFHQYTRTAGHPRLVQLLAKRYSKHFSQEVDPFSEVSRFEIL